MYTIQIKDATTMTWHNLHFLLEHYTSEILAIVSKTLAEQKQSKEDTRTLTEMKAEVIATVKTLKAMHTVIEHHRTITAHTYAKKGAA